MLDIETLGTNLGCVITQIGACYFDRKTGEIGDTFCENIRIQDSLDKGFHVSGSTLKFWFEQDRKVVDKMLKDAQDITKVLGHFQEFCKKGTIAWCHATFDIPILNAAYKKIGLKTPINYRKTLDIRTLIDLSGYTRKKEEGVDEKNHNALDDCKYQVGYVYPAIEKLTQAKRK